MMTKRTEAYGHVLKYIGVFGGIQGLNMLVSLVRNKLAALLLGPDGMGLASLLGTTVNFVSQSTNLGIPASGVKHLSDLGENGEREAAEHYIMVIRSWSIVTALLGMIVCVLAGPLLNSQTFTWGDHTLHYVMLAPAVALLALTSGEAAILKAMRRLRSLAVIQVYGMFVSLVVSVLLYYFYGQSGIVPVIVLTALSSMLLTVGFSLRYYPLRLSGVMSLLAEGMPMVRLGLAFVAAGILGSGAEMLIRSFLNVAGGLDMVGFYNAGYMMVTICGGLVFSSMENDFFPRLSSCTDHRSLRQTVNRQVEVSLLLAAPIVVLLMIAVPVLVPLLYTGDFVPVAAMVQVASFSVLLKAMSLPMSYISLSRGDSRSFLLLEAVYDVLLVLLLVVCYRWWGLRGTGVALSLSYVVDLLVVYMYTYVRYHYRVTLAVLGYAAYHLLLCLAAFSVTLLFPSASWLYWGAGVLMLLLSFGASVYVLYQKTNLWASLVRKAKGKLHG